MILSANFCIKIKVFCIQSYVTCIMASTKDENIANREKKTEKMLDNNDSLDLVSNGISFIASNSQQSQGTKSHDASSKEKLEDDSFRSKPSWIPDIRSQKDWDNFLLTPVKKRVSICSLSYAAFFQEQQGFLTIVEVYFDWAGPCHAMTRYKL